VAVIDSLIQWDHPDLVNNTYSVPASSDSLPDELHGWDFADNDADTRISDTELEQIGPRFQSTFKLSSSELIQQYESTALRNRQPHP
jgi:serine protease